METEQLLEPHYFIDENIKEDFDASQHLRDLVIDRFRKLKDESVTKFLYSIKITKTPTRFDYHLFSFEKIQDISRRLTNGMTSLGSISNRKFWNKYFQGGIRTLSVKQDDLNEYPSFTLNYLMYSSIDNLDSRISKNLSIRIKMIDPTLSFSIQYLGKYDLSTVESNIHSSIDVDLNSESLQKLGKKNSEDLFNTQFQRPRFLGELFKTPLQL